MATFKKGDMWQRFGKVDLFCITVCGTFKADGSLVMGAGIARQAKDLIDGIDKEVAPLLKMYFESLPTDFPIAGMEHQDIGLFQVKHHWKQAASKELIKRSMVQLFKHICSYPTMTVCLNFPGIGHGGLKREEVLPVVQLLPDNVEIWEYDAKLEQLKTSFETTKNRQIRTEAQRIARAVPLMRSQTWMKAEKRRIKGE